ncbi:hypothetical protein JD844_019511 [Phrynosoma platyrhinos]|uniref:NADPH oxidase organizer 1 n=1 Tax=Phrynosoma platyrhinos TaxID=52577 RepID=A0ABQ7TQN7_PHRPL|nr:hypothetical protein JD844_019511 [Phrynosoma platyrhinos]
MWRTKHGSHLSHEELLIDLKMLFFMLSVSWSDQNLVLIYRAFEEFRKLHKTLKRKFPIERGLLRSSDRTIPKFPAVNVILWKNRKRSRGLKSLKQLEIYCQDLLRTQPQISQGEDVIHFFEAQSQDLNPSFPENSSITFPSATGEGQEKAPARPSMLTITDPIVSPIYTCIEAFETTDMKNGVLRTYEAQEEDELSVKTGVLVEVLEKLDSGWWLVWYDGKRGYVPSVFLQPYRNPHHKFLALTNRRLCISSPNLLDIPGPLSETFLTREKRCHGREAAPRRRAQSCFLDPVATTASSGLAREGQSLPDISESLSKHEPLWHPKAKFRRVVNVLPTETFQLTPGCQGYPSPTLGKKPWGNAGLDKEPVGSLDPLAPAHPSPPVPPHPLPHEILQKCTNATKRAAIQMAQPRANPTACN